MGWALCQPFGHDGRVMLRPSIVMPKIAERLAEPALGHTDYDPAKTVGFQEPFAHPS